MLRDHFHPPLSEQRHWHGFHNAWATVITDDVSRQLPAGWFANKDRPEHRDAFVSKCDAFLREGVGLVIVDIVTGRHADLHVALLERVAPDRELTSDSELYAAAYRATARNDVASLDIWYEALFLGQNLPTMPLYLRGGPVVAVDLQSTYEKTCNILRIAD